jgi:uncharacterized membrane protein YecN with MAPEG domain
MNVIALTCVAALGFLLFGLGLVVSALRGRERSFSGHANDPSNLLHKLIRAHGNTSEYVAFIAVLVLYLGGHSPAPWVVWTMVAITVFRYAIVAGLIFAPSLDKPNPLRFIGALGTYVAGAALCYALAHSA